MKKAKTFESKFDTVEVCFSPLGNCESLIINSFNSARENIDAAIYAFTSYNIADALVKARKRGVNVRVILDGEFGRTVKPIIKKLEQNGIYVLYDNNLKATMHNKYAIVDDSLVITGSYNWTKGANSFNYENLLILRSGELARIFKENFDKMWTEFR